MVVLGTGSGQHGDVANATATWIGEAGGAGIDTAYDYGDEADIREGIARAGKPRDSLFLETKIPCSNYANAKANIASNIADLGVSSVDLTLIHFQHCQGGGFGSSVANTWKALEDALEEG